MTSSGMTSHGKAARSCASVSGFAGYRHVLVALSHRQPGIRLATCLSSYEHCRAISPLDARLNFGLWTVETVTSVASYGYRPGSGTSMVGWTTVRGAIIGPHPLPPRPAQPPSNQGKQQRHGE